MIKEKGKIKKKLLMKCVKWRDTQHEGKVRRMKRDKPPIRIDATLIINSYIIAS